MCVVSMVHDHFRPLFPPADGGTAPQPTFVPLPGANPFWPLLPPLTPQAVEEVKKLIADYYAAMKAAEVVDRLTGQPDCEDPEKAKLRARVQELETQLNALLEAVGTAIDAPKPKRKRAKARRKPARGR